MLNYNYTTIILNLEDVIITNVEAKENELHVHIELPRKKHRCPNCKAMTDRVHDYRKQTIKDIPFGRTTYLHLRKRRYCCSSCGKRFPEHNDLLPRYHRVTRRLVSEVIREFSELQPASSIARKYNISSTTAFRYFSCIQYFCKEMPEVLSIDEFKGNANGEKYQSVITDPKNGKVLDILPNRFESSLISYFKTFSNRNNVQYFVIDMNDHFRSVGKICFPKAKIIADKYHVIRQVVWAMENVRKTEQKNLSPDLRKYFKRSRRLLNKKFSKLTAAERDSLALMFEIAPRLSKAYYIKNRFLDVMHCSSSDEARKPFSDWLLLAESYNLPEFRSCITAYHNWYPEILNSIDVRWTNGFTEGCNNKTKVLKRVCFGMRNFSHFRNRILHCNT